MILETWYNNELNENENILEDGIREFSVKGNKVYAITKGSDVVNVLCDLAIENLYAAYLLNDEGKTLKKLK